VAQFASPQAGALTAHLESLGANAVEIFMDGPAWSRLAVGRRTTLRLLHGYDGTLALHAPIMDVDLASYRAAPRRFAVRLIKEAIRVARQLDARHLVVHPYDDALPDVDGMRAARARASLLELCDEAERSDVDLLVENLEDPTRDPAEVERFITLVSELAPRARAVLDVGHAHAAGWDIPAVIRSLGGLLGAVHLSDNRGASDEHLPIGAGSVAWQGVFYALLGLAPPPAWTIEYIGAPDDVIGDHLDRLRRLASGEVRAFGLGRTRSQGSPPIRSG
jgi:sugar phosphate isomerase/epimerase